MRTVGDSPSCLPSHLASPSLSFTTSFGRSEQIKLYVTLWVPWSKCKLVRLFKRKKLMSFSLYLWSYAVQIWVEFMWPHDVIPRGPGRFHQVQESALTQKGSWWEVCPCSPLHTRKGYWNHNVAYIKLLLVVSWWYKKHTQNDWTWYQVCWSTSRFYFFYFCKAAGLYRVFCVSWSPCPKPLCLRCWKTCCQQIGRHQLGTCM